jgi:hypothetical protein
MPKSGQQLDAGQPLDARWYVGVGVFALVAACVIGWFITANLHDLSTYGFGTQAYYILLAVFGIAVALFLFGVLRSVASIKGKQLGYAIDFGGPAALFVAVIYLGFSALDRQQQDFTLTVRMRTDDGRTMATTFGENAVTLSEVTVDFAGDTRTLKMDHDGSASFKGLPWRWRSSNVSISLASNAFQIKDPKATYSIPPGSEPTLALIAVPTPPVSQAFVIRSWTFAEVAPHEKHELYHNVQLQDDGEQVSGTIRGSISGSEWRLSGYRRHKFLGMAYGGVKKGGLGTGTYTMQQDRDDIYWGYAAKVECLGQDALFVRCPAVMFKKNSSELEKIYSNFLMRECEKVTLDPPETCTKAAE